MWLKYISRLHYYFSVRCIKFMANQIQHSLISGFVTNSLKRNYVSCVFIVHWKYRYRIIDCLHELVGCNASLLIRTQQSITLEYRWCRIQIVAVVSWKYLCKAASVASCFLLLKLLNKHVLGLRNCGF